MIKINNITGNTTKPQTKELKTNNNRISHLSQKPPQTISSTINQESITPSTPMKPIVNNNNNNSNHNILSSSQSDNSISLSFSIKKENHVNFNKSLINNKSNSSIMNTSQDLINQKVIVYNISDEFLIQMTIGQSDDPNLIKLRYYYGNDSNSPNDEILVKKSDIFYQPIDSFDTIANFPSMKIINELSILKNIQMRLLYKKYFSYVEDVFIMFNNYLSEALFFFEEFIHFSGLNHNNKNVLIYNKYIFDDYADKTFNKEFEFFKGYLSSYRIDCSYNYLKIFKLMFNLFNLTNNNSSLDKNLSVNSNSNCNSSYKKMKYLLYFDFNNKKNVFNFFYFPVMSSNASSNDLYSKSILFENNKSLNTISISGSGNKNKINKNLLNIINDHIKTKGIKAKDKLIYNNESILKSILSNNQIIYILNLLYEITDLSNMTEHLPNMIKLLILSYTAFNYKKIINNDVTNKSIYIKLGISFEKIELISPSHMTYFSNIIILLLFNYINNTLLYQFKSNRIQISNSKLYEINKNNPNDLIIISNEENKDDDMILNEVIKQRVEYSFSSSNSMQKMCISKCLYLYMDENISKFKQIIDKNDKLVINLLENYIFDLSSLNKFYSDFHISSINTNNNNVYTSNFIKYLKNGYTLTFDFLSKKENNFCKIYQFWLVDIGEKYQNFFATQEKIIEFLQLTIIIEYCNLYHNFNYILGNKEKYYRKVTLDKFFNRFLPILVDIDKKYDMTKNNEYCISLNKYLTNIQSFQGIDEIFSIEDNQIAVNYKTFETLNLLLKNEIDEKTKIIQNKVRSFLTKKLINNLRKKTLIIQKYYRIKKYKQIYNCKYKEINTDYINEFSKLIINKYLNKDMLVIKYVMSVQKQIKELENNNNTMNEYINSFKSECDNKDSFDLRKKKDSNHVGVTMKDSYEKDITNLNIKNNNCNSNNNICIKEKEISKLKESLMKNRKKIKKLYSSIVEYKNKLDVFVEAIKSNEEIKKVLIKNGIDVI